MSIIICNVKPDSVTMLTDAATCAVSDGTLVMIASKAWLIGEARCVVSAVGSPYKMSMYVIAARAACATFDDLVRSHSDIMAQVEVGDRFVDGLNRSEQWTAATFVLAGWSESRNRPESYIARNGGAVLERAPRLILPGAFENNDKRAAANYDPMKQGLETVEVCRRSLSNGHYVVGGFVELTTITRRGVTQKIVREWPDKIGEPINPFLEQVAA